MVDIGVGAGFGNALCRMLQRQDSEANITAEYCPRRTNKVYKMPKSKRWSLERWGYIKMVSLLGKD